MKKSTKATLVAILFISIVSLVVWRFYSSYQQNLPAYIVHSNGRLEMSRVDVATMYPGRIVSIEVDEGQKVSKDAVLARITQTEPQAQLKIAQAAKLRALAAKERAKAELKARSAKRNIAEIDYKNAQKLHQEKLISISELAKRQQAFEGERQAINVVRAAMREADAAIGEADAHIARIIDINDDMVLRSPMDGYIEYKLLEPGAVIDAGGRVVSMFDHRQVSMNVFLPISAIGKIQVGQEARIHLDGLEAVLPAQVAHISASAQFTPRFVETKSERDKLMYRVKLKLFSADSEKYQGLLKAGLTGSGYINMDKKHAWPAQLELRYPKLNHE